MSEFWDSARKNEANVVSPDQLDAYVKSQQFETVLQNEYKKTIQPNVYGCAISYDMGATQTGDVQDWVWGKTEYDNGGYIKETSSGSLVVPDGLGGLYLVFADVRLSGASGQLAAIYIEVYRSSGSYSTVETFSSAPGTPSGIWTAATYESVHFTSIRLLNLSPGDAISISGGGDGNWTSGVDDNQLGIVRFPFGS